MSSRGIRHSALSGLLGSKRIIVSVCAAIAMVLGAMSVGASVFDPGPGPRAEQPTGTPVFADQTTDTPDATSATGGSSVVGVNILAGQGPLTLRRPTQVAAPTATKLVVSNPWSIQFGPLDSSVGSVLGQLQVKASITAVAPVDLSGQTSITTPAAAASGQTTLSTDPLQPSTGDPTASDQPGSTGTDTSSTNSSNVQTPDSQSSTQPTDPTAAPPAGQPPVAPQSDQ